MLRASRFAHASFVSTLLLLAAALDLDEDAVQCVCVKVVMIMARANDAENKKTPLRLPIHLFATYAVYVLVFGRALQVASASCEFVRFVLFSVSLSHAIAFHSLRNKRPRC